MKKQQDELRDWVNALKAEPCMDCGGRFKPWQMDYDHRDGEHKTFDVSAMIGKQYKKEQIQAEIAKCDLVCANCHRDRTHHRQRRASQHGVSAGC